MRGLPCRRGGAGFSLPPSSRLLMTWSGVRSGISVVLALSLRPGPDHSLILMLTYMDPSSVASIPFFGSEVRLLTYIRPLIAASI